MNPCQNKRKSRLNTVLKGRIDRFRHALQPSDATWKTAAGTFAGAFALPSYARRLAGIVPRKGVKIP